MIPQFFHYCSSKFFRLSLLEWYRYLFSKVNRKLPETNKILKSGKSYTQGNKKGAQKNLNIKSMHLRSDLVFTSKPDFTRAGRATWCWCRTTDICRVGRATWCCTWATLIFVG